MTLLIVILSALIIALHLFTKIKRGSYFLATAWVLVVAAKLILVPTTGPFVWMLLRYQRISEEHHPRSA